MKLLRKELILLAILSLGLLLRIYNLGNESLWLDEGYSIKVANLNLFNIVEEISRNDNNPPLYYIILHFWVDLFGDTEFSARLLSVIFGFFSILMIYKVGSLIFDEEVGILSSLILGLSTFHIHYSQEARMYSLMSLLTLLSMYFFIKLLRERSLIALIGYILSTILLMYTHIYGLFIIIVQSIYLATQCLLSNGDCKLNFKRWVLLQLILIFLFTPWTRFLIINILEVVQNGFWIPRPSINSIIYSFFEYTGSGYLLLLFLITSFSIVNYEKIRSNIGWRDSFKFIESYRWNISLSNVSRIYLLLVWLFVPIVLAFTISRFSTPIYLTKYTISASSALYLLVAVGIRNINSKYIKLAIIGMTIALSFRSLEYYYTNINKDQWREVASYIDKNAKQGELLVFSSSHDLDWVFNYYSKRSDLIKKAFASKLSKLESVDEENIEKLQPTLKDYSRVWYILSSGVEDNKGLIKEMLNKSYNLLDYKKYIGIKLYLFEKKAEKNQARTRGM